MANHEENCGVVGQYNLCDDDQEMQVVWDQINHYSSMIAALEGQMQTRLGETFSCTKIIFNKQLVS
jgi:hypothetical protein